MRFWLVAFGCVLVFSSCGSSGRTFNSYEYFPRVDYTNLETPAAPDYSNFDHWAALPFKEDPADRVPDASMKDAQATAEIDVFFVHPTTFAGGDKNEMHWNADVNDLALNEKTDESTILHQASIFNATGRVFAPRYRQAHLHSYFTTDTVSAQKAFELAYSDVEQSFLYYLEHWNNGRPFIIAAHSQGMTHAGPMIKKHIDGTPLQDQFVAAYLVGLPGPTDFYDNIPPCDSPDQISCWASWRTYAKGFLPKYHDKERNINCTNPLTWTRDTSHISYELNQGTVLSDFASINPQLFDAQIHEGVIWVGPPNTFGGFLFKMENYHIADMNIFWLNIRENALRRTNNYLAQKRKKNSRPVEDDIMVEAN